MDASKTNANHTEDLTLELKDLVSKLNQRLSVLERKDVDDKEGTQVQDK